MGTKKACFFTLQKTPGEFTSAPLRRRSAAAPGLWRVCDSVGAVPYTPRPLPIPLFPLPAFTPAHTGPAHHGPALLHRFIESVTPTGLRRIGVTPRLLP